MINHLAVIMDGNRRWAKKNSLMSWFGHKKGVDSVKQLIEFALEQKIKIVSAYTFSIENFKRSKEEITYLFNLIIEESAKNLPDLIKNKVKIKFLGDESFFPDSVKPTITNLEETTANFNALEFNIFFCYGGKQEILAAVKKLAQDIETHKIKSVDITDSIFDNYLWSKNLSDPDLIIRTGNIYRLSNFLLYKAAYSELYFIDKLWPEITKEDLIKALEVFNNRKRNFGL